MFLPENDPAKRAEHRPEFTVIDAPGFKSDPARHGSRSDVFVFVNFSKQLVLIGGTRYAGEIKKSIFTILNYLLPRQGVLVDALLGQRRPAATRRCSSACRGRARRRCRAILNGGCWATMSMGGATRHLQLRGGLLREGDQPFGGGRAADLCDDAAFRHAAGKRGARPGDARAQPGRCVADRKHARLVSARRSSTTRFCRARPAIPPTS